MSAPEASAGLPARPGQDFAGTIAFGVVAVAIGLAALVIGGMEQRWYVAGLVGLMGAAGFLALPDKLAFLWRAFFLSLQMNLALWILPGHAGTGGVSIPLMVLLGATLLLARMVRGAPLVFGGRLRTLIAVLIGVSALSAIRSNEHFAGLSSVVTQLQLYVIYLVALNTITTATEFRTALWWLFLVVAMQSGVYFIQSATGVQFSLTGEIKTFEGQVVRPGGTVSFNPSGFANFLLPPLLIAVAFTAMKATRAAWGRLPLVAATLGAIAIGLTFTRAAWVALVLGIGVICWTGLLRREVSGRAVAIVGIATVVALLACWPLMERRLASESVRSSYDERAGLMRMAMRVIAAEPLLGVGPGAYEQRFKEYLGGMRPRQWLWTVHNAYLLRTAETGIPGGILFVVFLVAVLRQAVRLGRAADPDVRVFGIGWLAALVALYWEIYWDVWGQFPCNAIFWWLLGMSERAEAGIRPTVEPPR